jgi:hypothetical protein
VELSPGKRRVAFLAIVVALAGLGIYLVAPGVLGFGRHADSPAAAPSRPPAATPSATVPVPASSSPQTAPSVPPPPTPGPVTGTSAGAIYQWLPFRPADLAAAAEVAVQFGDLYDTFSYSESPSAYARSLQPVTTSDLQGQLQRAYSTPGLAGPRESDKQVSTGKTTITSLRAVGPGSLTFIVSITQKITSTKGTSRSTDQFAETVVGGSGNWQVNDIEPASAGNF